MQTVNTATALFRSVLCTLHTKLSVNTVQTAVSACVCCLQEPVSSSAAGRKVGGGQI